MRRVVDPRQQGFRLSQYDSLFEQVERVQPPAPEPIPLPEVSEADLKAYHAAELRQALRPSGEGVL